MDMKFGGPLVNLLHCRIQIKFQRKIKKSFWSFHEGWRGSPEAGSLEKSPSLESRNENICPHRNLHSNIHSSTVHNSQNVETTQMSISEHMGKQNVVYIHSVGYYSAIVRNEILIHATI